MNDMERAIDFSASADQVVARLIGAVLLLDSVGGIIVETEAYDREDPASHSFTGPTPRNAVMFGPPAHLYVYRSYGIHWCLNIVCREAGNGAALLIRALEPTDGVDIMHKRRGTDEVRLLCSGPGRLCQALGVTGEYNRARIDAQPFQLLSAGGKVDVVNDPRIGISKAMDVRWRFGLAGSRFISRSFR